MSRVKRGFTCLRVDHSLLGGAWVGEQGFGKEIGDSIYTAFLLQEAARLAKHERIDGVDGGEDSVRNFWTRNLDYSAASEQTTSNSLSPM